MSFIKKLVFHERFYSSWMVLFIDLMVITLSLGISLLVKQETIQQISYRQFSLIFIGISLLVFFTSRIHQGVIRHANTEDIFKIFLALLVINLIFIITWIATSASESIEALSLYGPLLFINFFISFSMLSAFRLAIKGFYRFLTEANIKMQKDNVLIYGAATSSILIKRALETQLELPICVKGFVDVQSNAINKRIEQTNVFPIEAICDLKRKHNIKKMMVTSGGLMEDGKKKAIAECIAQKIEVITVPPPEKWLNGQPNVSQFKSLKIGDLLKRQPIELCKENVWKDIRGKRVLVTGAAGSIGSELVRQLLNYEPEFVILLDQAETPLHDIRMELEDNGIPKYKVHYFVANICNKSRLEAMFKLHRPQIVFHAAAYKHVPMMEDHPIEAVATNVGGTKILADISLMFQVERFVMISTDKAVRPTNVMGATKCIAEMYIQSLNLALQAKKLSYNGFYAPDLTETKFITTRFGNVLESNGSVIPRFKAQIEKGGPITVTHPEITRYFMTIPEAIQLVLEAAVMGNGGEIFLFDMGKPVKICDLAENMIKLAGLIPYQDVDIVFSGLRPGEKLYEELLNDSEEVLPTHHKDIKISRTLPVCYHKVTILVEELLRINEQGDAEMMVAKMKMILPQFISNNSIYEKLDHKDGANTVVA